jgi:hypothetical protein
MFRFNGHGENATPIHESAMTALPCRAHIRLQANVVQQAGSMLPETPGFTPQPHPPAGEGGEVSRYATFTLIIYFKSLNLNE